MKKLIFIYFISLITFNISAQVPQKISYQAVVRNHNNELVANTPISMQITILKGSASGDMVYTETHMPTSNGNGLVSIEIGGGSKSWWRPKFEDIDWSTGPYFLKTEIDTYGGNNYTITGTSQILSVPYALHAKTAEQITGTITETDPVFKASVAGGISAADTSNWNNKQNQLIAGRGIIIKGNVIKINESYFQNDSTGGIAKSYVEDQNIQYDPEVIFASGFENGFTGWSSHNNNVSIIISDPDSSFSGNRVLKTTATRNVNTGGDVTYNFPQGHNQIYLRFYTKLDKNTIIPHHFVKIQAMRDGFWGSAGQAPPGDKGYWTGIEPRPDNTWNFYKIGRASCRERV